MSKLIVDTVENTAGTFTSGIDSLGPSTNFGGVGSYTAAVYKDPTTGVRRAAGYTVAGSLLRHVSGSSYSLFAEVEVHDYQTTSAGLSGTWRLMNTALRQQSDRGTAAILVRIS